MSQTLVLTWLVLVKPITPSGTGPVIGERLAPYMSVVSVGPNRGQHHCFV